MCRFKFIDPEGVERSCVDIAAVVQAIEAGEIGPNTQFFDSAIGKWSPAQAHDVFITATTGREQGGRTRRTTTRTPGSGDSFPTADALSSHPAGPQGDLSISGRLGKPVFRTLFWAAAIALSATAAPYYGVSTEALVRTFGYAGGTIGVAAVVAWFVAPKRQGRKPLFPALTFLFTVINVFLQSRAD